MDNATEKFSLLTDNETIIIFCHSIDITLRARLVWNVCPIESRDVANWKYITVFVMQSHSTWNNACEKQLLEFCVIVINVERLSYFRNNK